MTDPLAQHAAYLAALDRTIEVEGRHPATRAGLTMTLNGLRGRRSILVRHAPRWSPPPPGHRRGRFAEPGWWSCRRCRGGEDWPCPDYRDAAAGLPEDPP